MPSGEDKTIRNVQQSTPFYKRESRITPDTRLKVTLQLNDVISNNA